MTPTVHLYSQDSSLARVLKASLQEMKMHVEQLTSPPPNYSPPNYLIVLEDNHSLPTLTQVLPLIDVFKGKSLIVLPYHLALDNEFWKSLEGKLAKNPKLKLALTGELLNGNSDPKGPVNNLLSQKAKNFTFPSPEDKLLVASPLDLPQKLIKLLLSYSQSEPLLITQEISAASFVAALVAKNKDLKLLPLPGPLPVPKLNCSKDLITRPKDPLWLNKHIDNILAKPTKAKTSKLKIKKPKAKTKLPKISTKGRFVFGMLFGLLLLIVFPFVTLLSAASFLGAAAKSIENANLSNAKRSLKISSKLANTSESMFYVYKKAPLLGSAFNSPYITSSLINEANRMGVRGVDVLATSKLLIQGIVGVKPYDIEGISTDLTTQFGALYSDLAFFESNLNGLHGPLSRLLPESKFASYRKYLFAGKEFSGSLPSLLGKDKATTYLVLFQNNMELRPSGGFIGSFALVTFENGKLTENEVYDVYTADGQLKGYIRPPEPIEKHLGEAVWYMRDSNWDPDFTISADRAEWFLDKTLGRKVDGVVGIDLEVARSILTATGPIVLTDFADTINADNLYDKVQSEVEDDFFPGSRKKANYLTSIAKSLINRVRGLEEDQYLAVAKGLVGNLTSRDIQLALKESRANDAADVLGWTGSIDVPDCTGNCETVWLGVVEANVGVNKVNASVTRDTSVTIDVNNQSVSGTLTLNLKNNQSPGGDTYKNYLRILLPKSSTVTSVNIEDENDKTTVAPDIVNLEDRVEAGFLVEIEPAQAETIIVNWSNASKVTLFEHGKLFVEVRKQSGVPAHPLSIILNFPSTVKVTPNPPFSLTAGSFIGYNTTLGTDFQSVLSW